MATAEKEAIDKKAKLALNKITPDNYTSIKTQVLEIYKTAETDEEKAAFVKVFFLKACHEEKYTDLYIDLIKYITLTVFREKNGPKSSTKFSLLKEEFVESIRKECQVVFELLFKEYHLDPTWNEDDIMDYEYKHKKKLFGNLNFIALLVKNKMINQKVPFYVFGDLLKDASQHKGQNKLNTYEGACKFLLQIGSTIDKQGQELSEK